MDDLRVWKKDQMSKFPSNDQWQDGNRTKRDGKQFLFPTTLQMSMLILPSLDDEFFSFSRFDHWPVVKGL
jgi:hypothetical protein